MGRVCVGDWVMSQLFRMMAHGSLPSRSDSKTIAFFTLYIHTHVIFYNIHQCVTIKTIV